MSPMILIVIGTILIIFELLFLHFVLMFFGIGFLITGVVGFFVEFSWEVQILLAFTLSIILLFMLKKTIQQSFIKGSDTINQDFLNESGVGEIKDGMVYFKGTFWQSNEIRDLKDGDKVEVLGVKENKIIIKR